MSSDPLTILQSITGYVRQQQTGPENKPIKMGTIDPAYSGTGDPKVTFYGESTLSGKNYPYLASSYTPVAEDRVVMIPVGTTYLIVGSIDAPAAGTDAWSSFSPNWTTSSGTAPAIGDGTLTGRYHQVGKTVFFNIVLSAGSTTTFGSGTSADTVGLWQFDLPVQALEAFAATTSLRDNSLPANVSSSADCRNTSGGTNAIIRVNVPSGTAVNAQRPFVWASGDTMKISGVYEAV